MSELNEQYSFSDYLDAFKRRSRIFLAVLVFVAGTAIVYAYSLPDTYSSSAEMRIDLEGPNVDLLEPVMMTNYADQYIKSLEQQVMTGDNLRIWLRESGAYSDRDASENQKVRWLREDIAVSMVFTSVIDERSGREVNLITGFRTGFRAEDPDVVATVANGVASAYLDADKAARLERATAASEFLRQQIENSRGEIAEIESRIAQFKEDNAGRLPELLVLNMTSLERTERELESVQRDIRNQQQDRFFREAQLEQIRQRSGAGARLAALEAEYHRAISLYEPNHPDVLRIKRQVAALTATRGSEGASSELARLEAELAALQERYSDQHPDIVSIKRRIQEARANDDPFGSGETISDPLYLQLRAQINSIDTGLVSLRERANELRVEQISLQDRIAATPQVERRFAALQRELQTANLAFENLRNRLTTAQQTESFEAGEQGARLQKVRSAAVPSSASGPQRPAIVIIGVFLALSLAGGAAIIGEMMDNTVRGNRDVRIIMNTPAIAAVPVVQNSVSRSVRRRNLILTSTGFLVLASIVALAVTALAG